MSAGYYVEEACYYLYKLKLKAEDIGKQFNISAEQVANAVKEYEAKIAAGEISYEQETEKFWSTLLRENSGDEKVTLVDEKGRYYHGWRTELEQLPTENLVKLLVLNKDYSDKHPLSEFSKTQPAVGYDPLIPLRNIRRTVELIDEILQKRPATEKEKLSRGLRKAKKEGEPKRTSAVEKKPRKASKLTDRKSKK